MAQRQRRKDSKTQSFQRSFPFNQKVCLRSISFAVNVECVSCLFQSLESIRKISAQILLHIIIIAQQIIFRWSPEHRNVFDRWALRCRGDEECGLQHKGMLSNRKHFLKSFLWSLRTRCPKKNTCSMFEKRS